MHLLRRIAYALPVFGAIASASAASGQAPSIKSMSLAPGTPGTGDVRERDVVNTPVPVVQRGRLDITARSRHVEIPIATSRDWARPQDDVTRAIVVIPGWPRRDLHSGEHAAEVAGVESLGTIIVTPQFLTARDIARHHLPSTVLRWREDDWQKGRPSNDKASISSFQVVDAIFRRLANRAIFPHLNTIVLAGHSAGGQFVQRYAVLGRGEPESEGASIHVRYVVANPATYLYLTNERPNSSGAFVPFVAASCPMFNHWNYGLHAGVPSYSPRPASIGELEARFLRRDVVYLLGTADNNPNADGLDLSCAAKAQGATRYARGLAFAAYVHMLDPQTPQRVLEARDVGHSSYRMFSSACGLTALFDKPGCDSRAK